MSREVVYSERMRLGAKIITLRGSPYPNGIYDRVTIYISRRSFLLQEFQNWLSEEIFPRTRHTVIEVEE